MSDYYKQDFSAIDFRANPELYRVGKGEQGVLLVEPYKSEILPFWRFKTVELASGSAQTIYQLFLQYLDNNDFVGADMARKFLQMGFTRARRYANHKSGRKYSQEDKPGVEKPATVPAYTDERNRQHFIKTKTKKVLPLDPDPEKARAAEIFYKFYKLAEENEQYTSLKKRWKEIYG